MGTGRPTRSSKAWFNLSESTAIQPKDLCLDCGMCCGGHVFNYLALTGSDRDRLRAVGLHDAASQDRFNLPCQFLDGACCTIYASRPAVCASYRCKTLAQTQAGAISLDAAKVRLRKVAELRRAFEATIPDEMTMPDVIALATSEETPGQRIPNHYLPIRLTFVALQAIIDRHLREESDALVRAHMG